jgi:MFS family permease
MTSARTVLRATEASGIGKAADVPPLVPLRRNAGFRMLWVGQLLSDVGSQIGLLAYPLLILALTHSAVLAGVVGTTRATARLCLQLPAGALADRFDRRPDGQLEEAWAATEGRTYGASLAGPALGGVLFGLRRAVPFLADAVSYAASFGTVSRIRGRFRPKQAGGRAQGPVARGRRRA